MKNKSDVEIVPFFDMHIGGTTALHPNVRRDGSGKYKSLTELGGWKYSDYPQYYLNSMQLRIWNHFDKCLTTAAEARKDAKLFILSGGDMVEGIHHGTPQIVTAHISEQTETAEEIMAYIQNRLGFTRGDMLAFLFGTETHVRNEENRIAKRLNAYQYAGGGYAAHHLSLKINGVRVWAYHKGASAGQGYTRGNSCILKMKAIYNQCLQENDDLPLLILTGHTHDHHHATWTTPDGRTMHYIISASWQDKTRFANDNMATNKNKVGLQTIRITAAGEIIVRKPMLLASHLGEEIEL